jgi:2-C-methyl-D-erythritol 4-phosphate cytidylyltransferase
VSPTAALVLLAAGSGTRTGLAGNKVFAVLGGRSVLGWSLSATRDDPGIGPVVLVVRAEDVGLAARVLNEEDAGRRVRVVAGGPTRHRSEWNALQALAGEIRDGRVDVVAIHDAARPLAPSALFAEVVASARENGGAVPGRVQPAVLERPNLIPYEGDAVVVQTPQAFLAEPLLAAHEAAARAGFDGSDTAACLERFSPQTQLRYVHGAAANLKITFAEDLALAEALLVGGVSSGGRERKDGEVLGVADPPTG